MPIYEFECDACHHEFERLCSYAERSAIKCPKCRERPSQVFRTPPRLGWRSKEIRIGGRKELVSSRKQYREKLHQIGECDPEDGPVTNCYSLRPGKSKRERREALEKCFRNAKKKLGLI